MLVLNQCVLKQSVGEFNPADLFQSGTYKGYWFDFSDKAKMYTDAGTTNVASDGDLVYRIASKGSSVYLDRYSSDSNKSPWQDYGAITFSTSRGGYITTTQVDGIGGASLTAGLTYVFATDYTYPAGFSSNFGGVNWNASKASSVFQWGGDNNFYPEVSDVNGSAVAGSTLAGKKVITLIVDFTNGDWTLRVNGSQVGFVTTTVGPVTWSSGSAEIAVGGARKDNTLGSAPGLNGDCYQAFWINRPLSGADLTGLEGFFAAKMGISI